MTARGNDKVAKEKLERAKHWRRYLEGCSLCNYSAYRIFRQGNFGHAIAIQWSDTMAGSEKPLVTVQEYIDAFNIGDAEAMAACFATLGSILDGMAPHAWVGFSAPSDWYRDVLREGAHNGASNYHVTLGEPLHNDVSGDAGYVVSPATMTLQIGGRQITQTGAIFTVALRRVAGQWKIASWAWSKGKPAS